MSKQPMTVEFRSKGEVVGTLYMDEKPMRFEGDCDKAAEVFWDILILKGESLKAENHRLRADVQSAYKDGFRQGQEELGFDKRERRSAEQCFASSGWRYSEEALQEGEG